MQNEQCVGKVAQRSRLPFSLGLLRGEGATPQRSGKNTLDLFGFA